MLRTDQDSKLSAACCDLAVKVISRHGEVRIKVSGWSMLPALWPGDEITVQRCELTQLKRGQIAVIHRDGKIAAHRVKSIGPDHLIIRGDSLRVCDPPVCANEIAGQVVSVRRNGKDIDPRQTFWQWIGASVLRRSDFCSRVVIFLGRRLNATLNSSSSTLLGM
jgi:hypothetical protein